MAPPKALPRRPRVAIIVPTPDAGREMTRRCLDAARATTAHLGAVLEVVESSGPGFRFSRSVNRGIAAHPDADAWVLLNDDCFMEPGWLDAMLEAARRHPEVGVVGAVLRFPSGRVQHAGGRLMPPLPYLLYCLRKRAPFWGLRAFFASTVRDVPYFGHYTRLRPGQRLDFVTGACLLITRACRDRVGGFDEDFEFSFEDVDYCLRALDAGMEVALAVEAQGVHLERTSGGGLRDAIARSEAVFHARWGQRSRVLEVTRRGGRTGVHHGSGAPASCACAPAAKKAAGA